MVLAQRQVWHAAGGDPVHTLRWKPREQHRSVVVLELIGYHFDFFLGSCSCVCVNRLVIVCLPLQVKRWLSPPSTCSPPRLDGGRGCLVLLSSSLTGRQLTTSLSLPSTSELQVFRSRPTLVETWRQPLCGECMFTNVLLCVYVLGVTVLAVGTEQADTEQLRRVVTDGSTQNILYVHDAAQMDILHTDLADLLCGIARIPEVRRILENVASLVCYWCDNTETNVNISTKLGFCRFF